MTTHRGGGHVRMSGLLRPAHGDSFAVTKKDGMISRGKKTFTSYQLPGYNIQVIDGDVLSEALKKSAADIQKYLVKIRKRHGK